MGSNGISISASRTLRAIASRMPQTAADLDGIAGLGQKKREAYGAEVLRVVRAFTGD